MATVHDLDPSPGRPAEPADETVLLTERDTVRLPERARRHRGWRRRPAARVPEAAPFEPAEHSGLGDGGYRPGRTTRFLLWCGAVDRDLLTTRTEYYRYANLGGFVLLVSVLAGVTFVIYVLAITGSVSPAIIPFAVLWAAVIFILDRSIVGEPTYGDLRLSTHTADGVEGPRRGDRRYRLTMLVIKVGTYLFRIVVAVLVAYLIGEAVLLVIFRPEIQEELVSTQAVELKQAADSYAATKQEQITVLDQQIKDRAAAIDNERRIEGQLLTDLNDEASGRGGSGIRGDGRLTRLAEDKYRAQVTKRQQVEADAVEPDRKDQAEKATLIGEVAAIKNNDPAAVAAIPELVAQQRQILENTGWVEQEAALSRFLAKHQDSITVAAVPWIVRGILLAIDLTPIVLKLASGATLYGQRQYDRANRLRHADAVAQTLGTEHVDRMAEIDRLRSEAAASVVREREQWHRDWRLHYIDAERDTVESDRRPR